MSEHERKWLTRMTPAVAMRTRLAAAAALWTTVGSVLALVGVRWVLTARSPVAVQILVLVTAVVIGLIKSRIVFRRTAARITARLLRQGNSRCLGGFLSWKSWLTVAAMAILGRFLRTLGIPYLWIGLVYSAVGVGLALTSIDIWRCTLRSSPSRAD